jgi:nicotinate (nicotinamide) nucleotide adenylyltransferase
VEFIRRAAVQPSALGILSGTFNPPTLAHLALAKAALEHVDEVLFVLPRVLPHKSYEGVGFPARLEMLRNAIPSGPYSLAVADFGMFADIAKECRTVYGPRVKFRFVCGRDAAERFLGWDYGKPGVIAEMLEEFDLLVAARQGDVQRPAGLESRIHTLAMPPEYDDLSASSIRGKIARREAWQHLVPESIVGLVREHYGG